MFRSLMAAVAALTVGFATVPQQAKADDSDIVAGVIFGAILGGTIAVLADGNDRKDYRRDRDYDRRVYYKPAPRRYGHPVYVRPGYGRPVYYDRKPDRYYRDHDRYRHDDRRYYDDRRYKRDHDRRVERKVERKVERRVERKVERRVDRRIDRDDDRYKRERDRAGQRDPRVARELEARKRYLASISGRATGNDNVGGGGG